MRRVTGPAIAGVLLAALLAIPALLGGVVHERLKQVPAAVAARVPGVTLQLVAHDRGWFRSSARYLLRAPGMPADVPLAVAVHHGPVGIAWDGWFVGRARGQALLDAQAPAAEPWREFATSVGLSRLFAVKGTQTLGGQVRGLLQVPAIDSDAGAAGRFRFAGVHLNFATADHEQDGTVLQLQGRAGELEMRGLQGRIQVEPIAMEGRLTAPAPAEFGVQLRLRLDHASIGDLEGAPTAFVDGTRLDLALRHSGVSQLHADVTLERAYLQQVVDLRDVVARSRFRRAVDGSVALDVERLAFAGTGGALAASGAVQRVAVSQDAVPQGVGETALRGNLSAAVDAEFAANLASRWPGLLDDMLAARWLQPDSTGTRYTAAVTLSPTQVVVNDTAMPLALLQCERAATPLCLPLPFTAAEQTPADASTGARNP